MTVLLSPVSDFARVLPTCLFGFSHSTFCEMNLASFPHTLYFSLGEAVGALGLIFAVHQLVQPSWKITLNIRGEIYKNVSWIFVGLALIAVFASYIIPQIPLDSLPWIEGTSPFFFEGLGFLFFVAAPFSLYFLATKRTGLFRKQRSKIFYQQLLNAVASSRPGYLEAAIDVIYLNLDQITEAAKRARFLRNIHDKTEPKDIECVFACNVLGVILSEPRVIEYICTSRLDFLFQLFALIKEKRVPASATELSVRQIVTFLLSDKRSYLYQQLGMGGFSVSANLYDHIFFDGYLNAEFGLLDDWYASTITDKDKLLDEQYVAVFLKALGAFCRGYWNSDTRGEITMGALFRPFSRLRDYVRSVSYLIQDEGPIGEAAFWRFNAISHFFLDWMRLYDKALSEGLVQEYDKKVRMKEDYPRVSMAESMSGEIVLTMFEFLQFLPMTEKPRSTRFLTHDSFFSLLGFRVDHSHFEMRNALLKAIWENIEENVEKGFYPEMLKTYIAMMWYPTDDYPDYIIERNKLIDYLETHLVPKLLTGAKMVDGTLMRDALLPNDLIFNETERRLEWQDNRGKRTPFVKTAPKTQT
jgi:hypothetical protein